MRLEHAVRIGALLRHHLHDIPMFDYLAVTIEAENVDRREILHARPFLHAVQDDMIAFGKGALDGYAFAGMLARHALEKMDKAQLAGFDVGIMLNEFIAHITLDRVADLILIENQIVEGDDMLFPQVSLGHLADHFFFFAPITFLKQDPRVCAL
jgi:hypothetical protein